MNKRFNKVLKNIFLVLVLMFLYLPLVVVAVYSFNSTKSTTPWGGFTFDWYVKLFTNNNIMISLIVSLLLALFSTIVAVVIGTLCSIALNKFKTKFHKFLQTVAYFPVLTPEIIVGIAFMQIFSLLDFKFGMVTLLLAHISFAVPFVIIVVSARYNSLPQNLEDAARDLGANVWQAFMHITIPELLPGIVSGAALAFVMSLDDVIISFFMSGATTTTLPVKVYSMIKVGVSPEINALSTVVMVLTLICIVFVNIKKSDINSKGVF